MPKAPSVAPEVRPISRARQRVIIAGSRDITDYSVVQDAVRESGFNIGEVVSGHARGVDLLGERFAKDQNVKSQWFTPKWEQGRDAGYRRNEQMAQYADALVAVWDGKSPGTNHMIDTMRKLGKPVYIKMVEAKPTAAAPTAAKVFQPVAPLTKPAEPFVSTPASRLGADSLLGQLFGSRGFKPTNLKSATLERFGQASAGKTEQWRTEFVNQAVRYMEDMERQARPYDWNDVVNRAIERTR